MADNMEISPEVVFEDIDVDIQDGEDYAIGLYDETAHDASAPDTEDYAMIDDHGGDDAASYAMDDAADEPTGINLEFQDEGHLENNELLGQDSSEPQCVAIHDFPATEAEAAEDHQLETSNFDFDFADADAEGTDSIDLGQFPDDGSHENGAEAAEDGFLDFEDVEDEAPKQDASIASVQGSEAINTKERTMVATDTYGEEEREIDWDLPEAEEHVSNDMPEEESPSGEHVPTEPSIPEATEQTTEQTTIPASAGLHEEVSNHEIHHEDDPLAEPQMSANDSLSKSSDLFTVPRTQEVRVTYRDIDYSLFALAEADDPDSFFLADFSIASKPISVLFSAIREVIHDDLADGELLFFGIHELDLEIDEITCGESTTLGSIMNLRDKLFQNDGIESTEYLDALRLNLGTRPDYSTNLSKLMDGAAKGHGLSELVTQWSGQSETFEGDEYEEDHGHIDEASEHNPELDASEGREDEPAEHLDSNVEDQIPETVEALPTTVTNEEDDLIDYSDDEEVDLNQPEKALEKHEPADVAEIAGTPPKDEQQVDDDDFGLDLGVEILDEIQETSDVHQNGTFALEIDPSSIEDEINFDDDEATEVEVTTTEVVRGESTGTEEGDEIDYDDDDVVLQILPAKRVREDDDQNDDENEAKRPKS